MLRIRWAFLCLPVFQLFRLGLCDGDPHLLESRRDLLRAEFSCGSGKIEDSYRIKYEVAWLAVLVLVDGGEDEAELSLVLSEVVEELLSIEISAFVGVGLSEELLKQCIPV